MISLLIADDHPLYRDALKGALTMNFSNLTIYEADDLNSTVAKLEDEDVDLLLLDLHMPGSSDLFGFLHIQKQFNDLPIAVVSGTEDTALISKIMALGSSGFIPKTASAVEIAEAINAILEGDIWVPEKLREQINQVDEEFTTLAENVATDTFAIQSPLLHERWSVKQANWLQSRYC